MNSEDRGEVSDEELMRSYVLGDVEAFEVLYSRHAGRLYGYLRRKLASEGNVEDVFQETLLRLHRSRSRYDPEMPFMPWLFTVCHSTLVDHLRKDRSARETVERELRRSQTFGGLSAEPGPRADLLRQGLRHLSAAERELLSLRFAEDLPFRDVAGKLGLKPANARKVSSRAIQKLRTFLK